MCGFENYVVWLYVVQAAQKINKVQFYSFEFMGLMQSMRSCSFEFCQPMWCGLECFATHVVYAILQFVQ